MELEKLIEFAKDLLQYKKECDEIGRGIDLDSFIKAHPVFNLNVMKLEKHVEIYDNEELSLKNFTGKARFIIIAESVSRHCCFGFSIIDTKEGKSHHGDWNKTMCETFDKDEAVLICYALNNFM